MAKAITSTKTAFGYYNNPKDDGKYGRISEVLTRAYLDGEYERCHPQNVSDAKGKGFACEIKTGAGWLLNPCFDSKEEAQAFLPTFTRLKSQVIFYAVDGVKSVDDLPRFMDDLRLVSSHTFLLILHTLNLIIVKKGSNGLWGIAIQVVKTSKKRRAALEQMLDKMGMTIYEAEEKYNFT